MEERDNCSSGKIGEWFGGPMRLCAPGFPISEGTREVQIAAAQVLSGSRFLGTLNTSIQHIS
jgi:hypothetical protein